MSVQPLPLPVKSARPTAERDSSAPPLPTSDGGSSVGVLLKIEGELRKIRSLPELDCLVANETRLVTRSQQTFVFLRMHAATPELTAVSAMAAIDRSAPLMVWIEALVQQLRTEHGLQASREFSASSITVARGIDYPHYPLQFMLWTPFLDLDGQLIGGILQARMSPWTEADQIVSRRLADASAYTLLMLSGRSASWRLPRPSPRAMAMAGVAGLALCLVPVAMSALAPVEVTPKNAFVVTAPVDGVVDRILVEPNAPVKAGQPLVQMADTVLKNRLEIAEREVVVAEAKLKKSAQLAFVDARGRHELGVAHAEMQLRSAERDYARELLQRATIKADRDGVAFFTDPKDLIGRPVAVGERLMDLADPLQLEFKIDLPVADAIVLKNGARVKVFLDSDPLNPVEARLVRADFQARPRENQQLAFRLVAALDGSANRSLRLGIRGTAQVYSDKVPLAFYLFRRPLSAVRQWIGV